MLLSGHYLAATVVGLLLTTLSYLFMTGSQRKLVYNRIISWSPLVKQDRRTSSSKTPPRSVSPEKKVPSNIRPPCEYQNVFPPWRREALPSSANPSPLHKDNPFTPPDVSDPLFRDGLIPFTADYRTCAEPLSTYTPMGISLAEVQMLGDFPDYAELSGVPLPAPYREFKVETALPRPYRPFRWAYHQTMSLTKIEPDWWLELEQNFAKTIADRKELFRKYGKMMLDYLPGSELACKELMEIALQFLCARYPQYFSLSYSEEKGHVFHNGILGNETVIKDMHPLHVLLENVPEDFAVMLRNPDDGCYYLRAGVLCSSLGWNLASKLGMQLKEIHQPIPDYKEKMEFSMDRYFSKMPTARAIQRGSWGLEIDKPLFMPPGDPHEAYRDFQMPPSELPISRVHLRVDWQTLRRLPLSGAIIFNFKALFTPIEEFSEPHIPRLLSHILRHGPSNIMKYKSTWHVEHVALPALEAWAAEQEDDGVVEKGWEVRTLDESPFYPGWEARWKGRQGF
ncbi:MAG: hypothetical protein Q9208_006285 [Pyrenodesmia sp. 3 TL-2023]